MMARLEMVLVVLTLICFHIHSVVGVHGKISAKRGSKHDGSHKRNDTLPTRNREREPERQSVAAVGLTTVDALKENIEGRLQVLRKTFNRRYGKPSEYHEYDDYLHTSSVEGYVKYVHFNNDPEDTFYVMKSHIIEVGFLLDEQEASVQPSPMRTSIANIEAAMTEIAALVNDVDSPLRYFRILPTAITLLLLAGQYLASPRIHPVFDNWNVLLGLDAELTRVVDGIRKGMPNELGRDSRLEQFTWETDQQKQVEEALGFGSFGMVLACCRKLETDTKLAVKIMRRYNTLVTPKCQELVGPLFPEECINLGKQNIREVQREFEVLRSVGPNMFTIREDTILQDDLNLYLVTSLFAGDVAGLLRSYRKHKENKQHDVMKKGLMPEKTVKKYASEILVIVRFLHKERRIVHRDIKPQNLFVGRESGRLKIGDFGGAYFLDDDQPEDGSGTVDYMAPETFEGKGLSKASDMWAVGLTILEFLLGYPFYNPQYMLDNDQVTNRVLNDKFALPKLDPPISDYLTDFFYRIINKDKRKRMTVEEAMWHPMFVGTKPDDKKYNKYWDEYKKRQNESVWIPRTGAGEKVVSYYNSRDPTITFPYVPLE